MGEWRSGAGRLVFRAAACMMAVMLTGLLSRLWAYGQMIGEASAREAQAAAAPARGGLAETAATEGGEEAPSVWGFLRWFIGFDPTDPVSVVSYTLPGVQPIRIVDASVTVPDSGGAQDVAPGVAADPGLMPPIEISGQGPQVLIYHSHTQEAYRKLDDQVYAELPNTRTVNPDYNVVRVGRELAGLLNERYGILTVHDTRDYEGADLGTAYSRSCAGVEDWLDRYGDIKILVDIHRDAYNSRSWDPLTVTIGGERAARIMIIVGKGENSAKKPDWEKNMQVARRLADELNAICPGLAMPVNVKNGRYNQHLSPGTILVEMGNERNTLGEAVRSAACLAQALAAMMESSAP